MFASLALALATRSRELITLAVNPLFDAVRDDPRFVELTQRVGLPLRALPAQDPPLRPLAEASQSSPG